MSAIELGATLYIPALNTNLRDLAYGANTSLRSVVICLEDSILESQVDQSEAVLARTLATFRLASPKVTVFIRPRNIEMLYRILKMNGIDRIKGFVLPKVTTANLSDWITALIHTDFEFMPTIEGEEAFDRTALARVCDQLRPYRGAVTAVRIGGNDILSLLGQRRSRIRTAYDGPLGSVIRDISAAFVPHGIPVSAPVFEHYSSLDLLREEVLLDIEHGLLTKTAIHPAQLDVIQELYRPTALEMVDARAILDKDAAAVFGSDGSMCEPATHTKWAGTIIQRAQVYGVADSLYEAEALVA